MSSVSPSCKLENKYSKVCTRVELVSQLLSTFLEVLSVSRLLGRRPVEKTGHLLKAVKEVDVTRSTKPVAKGTEIL